jgi:Bacterial Ig-like domain
MKTSVSLVVLLMLALVGCGGETTTGPTGLNVVISSPNADVFTRNSLIKIKLTVTGDPGSVELLKDGALLTLLNAPYEYDFETINSIERTYALTARVKKTGFADVLSAVRQITVDRTAPTVTARVPVNAAPDVFLSNEISVTFNEAVAAASVTAQSAQLRVGASVVPSVAALDTGGTKLTLRPTTLPSLPATMDVVLTGITDLAGNATDELKSNFVANEWPYFGGSVLVKLDDKFNPPRSTGSRSLAVDANRNPYLVLSEASGIYVKRWNGTAWSSVGTTALDLLEGVGGSVSIALNPSGNPIVNFVSAGKAYVKRWNGTDWELLGGTFVPANPGIDDMSMILDSTGNPFVALSDRASGLFVKHWNGSAWTDVGTKVGLGDVYSPSITLNPAGKPIVAWIEGYSLKAIVRVKEWNATDWISVGGAVNTVGTTMYGVSVAQGPTGFLYVAYSEVLRGANYGKPVVYVKALSLFGWAQVGPSYINQFDQEYDVAPALVVDPEGNPAVALAVSVTTSDNKASVRNARLLRWNWNDAQSVWKETSLSKLNPEDGYLFGSGISNPSLAFDSKGDPLVMYPSGTQVFGYDLRIQRRNRIQ